MKTLLVSALGAYFLAIMTDIRSLLRAPEGYQDENGFHYVTGTKA